MDTKEGTEKNIQLIEIIDEDVDVLQLAYNFITSHRPRKDHEGPCKTNGSCGINCIKAREVNKLLDNIDKLIDKFKVSNENIISGWIDYTCNLVKEHILTNEFNTTKDQDDNWHIIINKKQIEVQYIDKISEMYETFIKHFINEVPSRIRDRIIIEIRL